MAWELGLERDEDFGASWIGQCQAAPAVVSVPPWEGTELPQEGLAVLGGLKAAQLRVVLSARAQMGVGTALGVMAVPG